MVDFDTPQSKVIKRLLDAYCSLDVNNLEPLLSKDYQYLPLPENTDHLKHTKESHLQTWGGVFSLATKFEVRIQHRRAVLKPRLIFTTPR